MGTHGTLRLYTFNHENSSLEERDALAYAYDEIREFLPTLRKWLDGEHAVLSTCNRTEFIHFVDDESTLWPRVRHLVADFKGLDVEHLGQPDVFRRDEAARHLFRVAASLESLALGENEILGQVKDAHQLMLDADFDTPVLDQLFQYAVRTGKDVRTETALCEGSVSVSSVAVDLAHKIFGDFAGHEIALVGAGETAETAAEHFRDSGADSFTVVNRSESTGRQLAEAFDGRYLPLDELETAAQRADVLLVATGASEPIVTEEIVESALRAERTGPLFVIDVSNPRNVSPEVGDLTGVYLYNMDDLQRLVRENRDARREEIPAAEGVVDRYVDKWKDWLQQQRVTPTISTLARYFDDVRQQEMSRLDDDLSESERTRIEKFSESLVNKLLHHPIQHLRTAADKGTLNPEQLDFVWTLYNLREFEGEDDDD